MPRTPPAVCVLAAVAFLPAWPLAAAPSNVTYKPPLRPRFVAGQAFGYNASVQYEGRMNVTEFRKQLQPDGPPKLTQKDVEKVDDNFAIDFQTDGALARTVFSNGALREALFLVNHCTLTNNNDGKTETMLPPGAILGMRVLDDGQVAFAVNGEAPTQQLADRLSLLLAQLGDGRYTYDEMLGPPQPVAVGTRWPVNGDAIMHSVLSQMFPGTNQVAGSMTLEQTKLITGQPVAVTSGAYILGGSRPPFPAQIQARPSMVGYRLQITAPLTGGPGEYDYHMNASITHEGNNGDIKIGMSEARIEFTIALERDVRFTLNPQLRPLAALTSAPPIPDLAASATKPGVTTAQLIPPMPMPRTIAMKAQDNNPPPPLVDLPPDKPAAAPTPVNPLTAASTAPAKPVEVSTARSFIAPPPPSGIFGGAKSIAGNGTFAPLPPPEISTPAAAPNPPALPSVSPFDNAKPLPQPGQ